MATGVSASSLSFLGLLRSASQRTPGKIVVEDDTCTRTCRELLLRSEALARYLLRRLENAEADGRVIAILAENSVAYAETVFGAAFAGLPLVTVNKPQTPALVLCSRVSAAGTVASVNVGVRR